MTPSGLVSAVTFLIVIPTALIFRLLTLLNLNAVMLYYPSGLSPLENRTLPSVDNSSTLEFDSRDRITKPLPSWLTHILRNHNLSQPMPQWKGHDAPIVVSIHLTVDFVQPSFNRPFDHMVTINMTEQKLQNASLQAISSSYSTLHLHGETGFDENEDRELCTEMPFQPVVTIDLLIHALGLMLACLAVWRQALYLKSSCCSLFRMTKNLRAAVPLRGHGVYANAQKDPRAPCEAIVFEESTTHDCPSTHVESYIREWTPEDDYETEVTNVTGPDTVTLPLCDLVAGSEEPRPLGITLDSLSCPEFMAHSGSVPHGDSDCIFVNVGAATCRPEFKISLSYCKPDLGLPYPRSRPSSFESHYPSLPAENSKLGTSGTLGFCTIGKDQHTVLDVSESGYFTSTEVSLVHSRPNPPRRAPRKTSLIHVQRQPALQSDPSTVASRELVLYSRHPRAWEIDDLVAAWRCFIQSRGGKKWVTYGLVGITVLLQGMLVNFLASDS